MNISQNGLKLIVHYETGGKPERFLEAYWDAHGKVWTIGIGSTVKPDGSPVKQGDKITLEEAYQYLESHLQKHVISQINSLAPSVTQDQFDALASFVYNLGAEALKKSTLLRFVNAKAPSATIAAEFAKWNKAGGKILAGLVKRRKSEGELYTTGKLNLY